jgi:hypothetical protein
VILKGNQRGGGRALAAHLTNTTDNDHVELHELRGFASTDLAGAFLEIEAAAKGTQCQQPFFSVSLNPPPSYPASFDQYDMAADAIEAKYPALAKQPRAIVFHEKEGRRHAHAVWSRIDTERGRAIPLPHSRLKLRDASRSLYAALGLEAPAGILDRKKADPLNYDPPTWQQAKRLGEDPRDLKAIIRQAWAVSDNRASFERALEHNALYLARGDRRGFVVVHHSGEAMSLTRYVGLKKGDVESRIGTPAELQTIDQVRGVLRARMTATVDKRLDDLKQRHAREMRPLRDRVGAMKQAHQAERRTLKTAQAVRQQAEELTRANRLRTGVMGLWDRLSGKRGKVSERNAREAQAGRHRDRDERQAQIDRQRTERGALQADIVKMRGRHQHDRQFQRAELAVMLSMLADNTREDFQGHAQEIEASKGKANSEPSQGVEKKQDHGRGGRSRRDEDGRGRPRPR